MSRLLCGGAIVAAAVIAFPVSADSPASSDKSCTMRQYASLHVDRSYHGVPTVEVMIGDAPVRLWLNTASTLSALAQSTVQRFGLSTHPLRSGRIQMGDKTLSEYATVPAISLGSAQFKDVEIVVGPKGQTPVDANAPAGFIGMDMLGSVDLEFDLGHDKINLFSPDHCPDKVVYWGQPYDVVPMRRNAFGDLYFVMALDGKKVQTKLSTGGESSRLDAAVAKALYGWDGESPDGRDMSLSAGGLAVVHAKVLRNLQEGECAKHAHFVKDHDGAIGFEGCSIVPLYLGAGVLSKLRLYVSTKEQKLYFTVADAPAPALTPEAK